MSPVVIPTMDVELSLFESGVTRIVGCDEVGRGALAGPVAVGVTMISASVGPIPEGLRDSKLVSEPKRVALAPRCIDWVEFSAVGLASAAEIDEFGIIRALGLAGARALSLLVEAGADLVGSLVILDGNHDYLSPAFGSATVGVAALPSLEIVTRIKADRDCASVAAASVIAKVHRDSLMIGHSRHYDGYGWAGNKGYGSAEHMEAIERLGATELHRHTWLKDRAEQSHPAGLLADA